MQRLGHFFTEGAQCHFQYHMELHMSYGITPDYLINMQGKEIARNIAPSGLRGDIFLVGTGFA
jgi:hypothetical protein